MTKAERQIIALHLALARSLGAIEAKLEFLTASKGENNLSLSYDKLKSITNSDVEKLQIINTNVCIVDEENSEIYKSLSFIENSVDVLVSEVNKEHNELANLSRSNFKLIEKLRILSKQREQTYHSRIIDYAKLHYESIFDDYEIV